MPPTATTSPSGEPMCPEPAAAHHWAVLVPPRDADEEAFRRWLATSAWPEVVFATA